MLHFWQKDSWIPFHIYHINVQFSDFPAIFFFYFFFFDVFTFPPEMKPCCFIRCLSIFPGLLVPYSHRWHLKVPGLGSYNMNILSLWVFTSLPCSDSKSHSLQEKSSLTLCSRLTRFPISIIDMALNSQFIYWLLMNPQVVPVLTSPIAFITT